MNWLEIALNKCILTEEVEEYLLGRGAKDETIAKERIVTWQPTDFEIPDKKFVAKYGPYGEKIKGFSACPVYSPRGSIIGMEARSIKEKIIEDYRLIDSKWNPFFLGMKTAMEKIWKGGDIWVVEGLFDLCPLQWVIKDHDCALATVTAGMSKNHVEFLRRHCQGVVRVAYDRDEGGRRGAQGAVDKTGKKYFGALDRLKRVDVKCVDVSYLGGKDPGVIWDHGGVAAIRQAFNL